jgi:isopropylmalate/homocitrate/citramalate synthase
VAAVLNCPLTYECIPPEVVGNHRLLRLGKHSGITYIRKRVEELGFEPSDEHICEIVLRVKVKGEEHGIVSDQDFKGIVESVINEED